MSKNKTNFKQKSNDSNTISDANAFTTVIFYCMLIIVLPILSFFTTKFFLFDSTFLQLTQVQSNIYAAVVAVIALHCALGLYLYRAYFDQTTQSVKTVIQKED